MAIYECAVRNLRLHLPKGVDDIVRPVVGDEQLFCVTYLPNPARLEIRSRANHVRVFKDILWPKDWNEEIADLHRLIAGRTEWTVRDATGKIKFSPYSLRYLYEMPDSLGHKGIVAAARQLNEPVAAMATYDALPDGNAPVLVVLKQSDLERALATAPTKSF